MIDANSIMMWLGFIVIAIIAGIASLFIYDWFQKRKMLRNCDKYLESEKKEEKVNGGEHEQKITYDNSGGIEVPEPATAEQNGTGEQSSETATDAPADSGRSEERRDISSATSESSEGDSGRNKGFKGFANITEWRRNQVKKMREKRLAKLAAKPNKNE